MIAAPPNPRFSVISAVYNVSSYLPEFLRSLEEQTTGLDEVEILLVDDGSTDDSASLLDAFARRHPGAVTMLTQANSGQGAARNLGLRHARSEWVTFPDPDDLLEPSYLASVDRFIASNPSVEMVATSRVFYDDATGARRDTHRLRSMFDGRDRAVDLDADPSFFHGSASAGFFRTSRIAAHALEFDPRVRPNFEDGHFCCRYLLDCPTSVVGFVGSAVYQYRRRADGSSTVQKSLSNPDRFVRAPRYGYLDVLERGARRNSGQAPGWIQNLVLYELSYYFAQDERMTAGETAAHGDVARQFVATLAEIAAHLEPTTVASFDRCRFDSAWRDILVHAFSGESWTSPFAAAVRRDADRGEVQIGYRFVGERPSEEILVDGVPFVPQHAKVWTRRYWDHELLHERLAWVPNRDVRIIVNGRPLNLRDRWADTTDCRDNWVTPVSWKARLIKSLARLPMVRHRFADAWVLMDRRRAGDDNAERLFRYLCDEHREINAWFAIEKGTADWRRLHDDGYGSRVIGYGGLVWRLLMLNTRHVVSSQIDNPAIAPWEITRYGPVRWRTTFLQHGVIKDDLSRWLNSKPIDLLVTSTPAEHHSIVDDNTPYVFTSRETRMVGLARFDRLLELGRSVDVSQRDVLLVCPTWRHWLAPTKSDTGHDLIEELVQSEWVTEWLDFLRDPRLKALADAHGLQMVFLPHTILQPALPELDLPSHVRAIRSEGIDIQSLMARATAFVTDYSSMAFNAAYIDRPVVYFQFDDKRVLTGGHTGRQGYFDYRRDGFGPVVSTLDECIDAVRSTLADPPESTATYRRRVQETFPTRDGKCCERTVQAILDIDHAAANSTDMRFH